VHVCDLQAKWGTGRKRPSDYERLESAVYEKHLKAKVTHKPVTAK